MKKSILAGTALAATAALLTGCGSGISNDGAASGGSGNESFVNIVKLTGGDWFNRMEVGNQEWAKANGAKVTQTAGDDSSAEKQIAVISDVIPQQPAAITVVPNAPESIEAVLKRAQDAGIVVITHEAAGIKNTDADIEAFNDLDYGAHQMDLLADCMGGSGTYAHFVGGLTVTSHNNWVKGAAEQAAAEYPDITSIGDPISSDESADTAYQRTKELLATYPDLKGILGSASTDVVGAGKAVAEAGRSDDVCVIGTSLPSYAGSALEAGDIDVITFWDPSLAGQAMLTAAQTIIDGGEIAEGTDLGVSGYESLVQSEESPSTFYGTAWVDVTAENAADYPF
ncbi:substrate-binding domain-containing protein [Microbacterium dauci]|uniref:Substrate-binding domain-containing protein n=1 Tax=Microbacterium dauci TaxID=3048008 RepID=A0ABT6ZEF8_9MICO|nr:substrate-binding domain-containing protein [Microbacterium sp. LX3-4]MDJ1114549.1 substrate-binding domain-containing protein [Microbacterium sp. LX3-4]